jgi:ABC-type spermidine/putrescine transport system permease subunit II
MAAVGPREWTVVIAQTSLLIFLYIFLYFPIFFIIYVSFVDNTVWPFPPEFTLEWYERLWMMSDFHLGLFNSVLIGAGTGALACIFAASAAIGLLKYQSRWRGLFAVLYLSPLFVAGILIGISSLMFHRNILGLPGHLSSAVLANTTQALSFAFLVILAQLTRYDWRMDEAAMVFGARPTRCFWEVTLPTIWPSILGAFLVSFILAFNNLDITFYNIGAIPTLPTIAWGTLRHGIEPELYSLAAIINGFVFFILILLFFLIRLGLVRLGYRGE